MYIKIDCMCNKRPQKKGVEQRQQMENQTEVPQTSLGWKNQHRNWLVRLETCQGLTLAKHTVEDMKEEFCDLLKVPSGPLGQKKDQNQE